MRSRSYAQVNLTPRELEILRLIADAKTDIEIGDILGISKKTVNYHVEKIKIKFAVNSRMLAIVCAFRAGIIH